MLKYVIAVTMVLGLLGVMSVRCPAEEKPTRQNLGRTVKLRILVDKVMQPTEGWVTKEWMVAATAEAGFNVFSPRRGHERLDEVRQVTEWCEKYGIFHLPWMRGTLRAPTGPQAAGKRLVWSNGSEQPLWSPNADEFWEWMTKYIVAYAKISAENPHLMGVFLDFENYAPGRKGGNCYYLSYDDLIMGKFAEAKGLELPELALEARKQWLEEQGLHEEFARFQINHWRERCRKLRQAIDRFDPTFQFCIYPAPGTPFLVEAAYPEWATEAAPLILADACTYGRPSKFLPQAEALEANRRRLRERMKIPQERGIPYLYAGGIDPVVAGADPEFCGKNAVMISEATDGYWVFYEGPKYEEDHPQYWKWFTWANRAIAAGNFAAWHEPRETPEDFGLSVLKTAELRLELAMPEVTGETVEFPLVKMRGDNLLFLACKAGQPVEVVLRNHPVAYYRSLLAWELRDLQMNKLTSGTIPHDETGRVHFTPEKDGMYVLGASAGSCAYSVVSANVPVGLYAERGLSFIYGVDRLYFHVTEGLKEFTVQVKGTGAETVRVNVFDPTGAQVASAQTTPQQQTVTLKVPAGNRAGQTWSLQLTKADEGVLEDHSLTLGPELLPMVSLTPEQVFRTRPAQCTRAKTSRLALRQDTPPEQK